MVHFTNEIGAKNNSLIRCLKVPFIKKNACKNDLQAVPFGPAVATPLAVAICKMLNFMVTFKTHNVRQMRVADLTAPSRNKNYTIITDLKLN